MSDKKDQSRPLGPGNTFWYINDDGEIYRCRWNDGAWCNATGVTISDGKKIREWEILKLINDAYKMGMADQQIIIRNALGVN